MKPERVVRDLDRMLADDIVAADCGHNTGLTAQYGARPRTAEIERALLEEPAITSLRD
jgi:hypothetical protein